MFSTTLQNMRYAGGKNGAGVYQKIINYIPPHQTYVEPFLGGGAVMRFKLPAEHNIGRDKCDTAIKNMPSVVVKNDYTSCTFDISRGDGIAFLQSHKFSKNDFVYCDPPYLREVRRTNRDIYQYEMTDAEHIELLETIKSLPCMVMISGYQSTLYETYLNGWNTVQFQAQTRSGKPATEWLWFNYEPPTTLHDYRYLGECRTDRQRIKRKKERWVARLEKMPLLERQALLGAIEDVWIL